MVVEERRLRSDPETASLPPPVMFRCGLCANLVVSGEKAVLLLHCGREHAGLMWQIYFGPLQLITRNDYKRTCEQAHNPTYQNSPYKTRETIAPKGDVKLSQEETLKESVKSAAVSTSSSTSSLVSPRPQFVGGSSNSTLHKDAKIAKPLKSAKVPKVPKYFMCLLCVDEKAAMFTHLNLLNAHYKTTHPQVTPSYARGSLEKLTSLRRTMQLANKDKPEAKAELAKEDDVMILDDSQEVEETDDVMIVSDSEDAPASTSGDVRARDSSEPSEREILELIESSAVGAYLGRMAVLEKHRAQLRQRMSFAERFSDNLARKSESARDLQCPVCCHEATSVEQLFKHLQGVHANVDVITHVLRCFLCGFDFKHAQRRLLRAHLRSLHGFEVSTSRVAELFSVKVQPVVIITKCEHCKFKTVSGDIMNRHHCERRPVRF